MNRYRRVLLPLAVIGLLAACAPSASKPSAEPSETAFMSAEPMPTETAAESASATPSPSVTPSETPHEMGGMGGMGGSGDTATVEIVNFGFDMAEITVSAGTEVTFTNLDSAPHTVTAGTDADPTPDVFDSGLIEQGESFTFVFDEPGTYVYFCDRHPPMEGSVTVEP